MPNYRKKNKTNEVWFRPKQWPVLLVKFDINKVEQFAILVALFSMMRAITVILNLNKMLL